MRIITKLFFLLLLSSSALKAQDYTIVPTRLNAQGQPGDLFLARATILNNSAQPITIFMERIVENLPANWTSCFCYPFCIAPFIDTLRFTIAPNSYDSIMPNFHTDSIPGLGTIVSRIYQIGYESFPDTITFTGSTLSSGINSVSDLPAFLVYPNPTTEQLNIHVNNSGNNFITLTDALGKIIYSENYKTNDLSIDVTRFPAGFYLVTLFSNNHSLSKKIHVTK